MLTQRDLPLLLQSARLGDPNAMEALMAQFRGTIVAEVESFRDRLSPHLSCQDLYQEVWIRVWSRLPGFVGAEDHDNTRGMFVKWLQVTTRSVAINILEKANAQCRKAKDLVCNIEKHELAGNDRSPSSLVNAEEMKTVLEEAISGLGDVDSARILKMRYSDGLTLKSIAQSLSISEDLLRYRLRGILAKLQTVLRERGCQ